MVAYDVTSHMLQPRIAKNRFWNKFVRTIESALSIGIHFLGEPMDKKDISKLVLLLLVLIIVGFLRIGFHLENDQEPTPAFTRLPSSPRGVSTLAIA